MRRTSLLLISVFSLMQSLNAGQNCIDGPCMVYTPQIDKYINACRSLDKASELTQKIKNAELKDALRTEIESCQNCFKMEFLTKDFKKMSEKAILLQENVDEILADSDQVKLKMEIADCIEHITVQLEE